MTESSIWDTPGMNVGGDYFKFDNPGDTVSGTITHIGTKKWEDGKIDPQIELADANGEEITVTCGQTRLKVKLMELRPNVGDFIRITFTQVEKRAGGKTLKHFDVQVGGGGAQPAPAPAAAPVPAAQPAPVASPAPQPLAQPAAPAPAAGPDPWNGAATPAPAPAPAPAAPAEDPVAKVKQLAASGFNDEQIAGFLGFTTEQVAACKAA